MAGPSFSIVLPCFNEGARIAASLATLAAWFGPRAEILVIDDGSDDDTAARAEREAAAGAPVRVHRLPGHRGKGAAIRAAVPLVRTDAVVFMDADLAFDRASVERALDALDASDVAIGNRRLPSSSYEVPVRIFGFLYRRHALGRIFSACVRLAAGVPYRDTQCGLKAFRRPGLDRIAPALSVDGFALDVEMLMVARALGLRLTEVPVHVRYDSSKSSVKLLASGRAMMADLARLAWRRARGIYAPARLQALPDAGREAAPPSRSRAVSHRPEGMR